MKFEIETKRFAQAARIISIVATRAAFPNEAAHVLIQAQENKIIFTATDRVCSIKLSLNDVAVSNPGEISFYVPTLNALCSRLVGENVLINAPPNSTQSSFSSGGFKGSMNLIACSDLKDINIPKIDTSLAFSSQDLSEGLGQVYFAAADEKSASSLYLCDIKINSKRDYLEFVACDARRLAMRKLVNKFENPPSFDVSLPARYANKVRMLLKEIPGENIYIGVHESTLILYGEKWCMACLLSKFVFPSTYQNMIPSRKRTKALLGRQIFLGALRRSSCLGLIDDTYPRTITLSIEKNRLKLNANNEVGKALEYVAAQCEGPPLEISVSANHMEQGLEAIDCEQVILVANSPKDPLLIEAEPQDLDYIYVLIPKV